LTSFMQYRDFALPPLALQEIIWETRVISESIDSIPTSWNVNNQRMMHQNRFLPTSRSSGYLITVHPPVSIRSIFFQAIARYIRRHLKSGNFIDDRINKSSVGHTFGLDNLKYLHIEALSFKILSIIMITERLPVNFSKKMANLQGSLNVLEFQRSEGGIRLKLMNGDCRSGIGIPCIDFTILMSTHSVRPI